MGVVVGATHLHLQQPIALKFLSPELLHNPQIVERFVREARASAQLRGEHVCRVSDVGAFDDGSPYIVMELLEGSDLASLLHSNGPLPVTLAADYVLQACLGVAEAHSLGIVHRDLKPANLFLTRRPDGAPLIKVLDFGIAKAQNDRNFNLTQTSAVLGSPGYMSPEQLRSTRDVDARSDIWSIGVILYELVSGHPPFTGGSITELALRIAMDPTPMLVGRMPQGFDQVIERCLAKDATQRYPDLANLAHALAAYAGAGGWDTANAISRLLHGVSGGSAAGLPPATLPPATQVLTNPSGVPYPGSTPTTMGSAASSMVAPAVHRRRWAVIAGAAITVIAGAVITIAVASGGRKVIEPATPLPSTAVAPPPAALDAGVTVAATPAPDAAPQVPAAALADATVQVASGAGPAATTDTVVIDAGGADAAKRPRGPRKGHPSSDSSEDFGESRF